MLRVALVAMSYGPALANGFIWDDDAYVTNNVALRSLHGLYDIWLKPGATPQYYPLVFSAYWVEYGVWGLDPRGYHLVNVLLHATSTLLVWRLLARLAVPGGWLAAAIFAVHPVHVESVAWITERKNVLSCALALGSILAYLRFSPPEIVSALDATSRTTRHPWCHYGLALVLYIAALLSKTVTASVPAILLVIYWWKRGHIAWRDAARLAPFFAVGLAMSGITIWIERAHVGAGGEEWELSSVDRVLVAGRALWFYAGKLLWPETLVFFYPRWVIDSHVAWQYLFPSAALAALCGLWLLSDRLGHGPLAAVLVFVGVLTPALGFFDVYPFRYSFVADHFQYHASIALIALVCACCVHGSERMARPLRRLAPLAGIGVVLSLGTLTAQRTLVFRDVASLYENTLELNPAAWAACQNLGGHLYLQGNYDAAIVQFRRAIAIRNQLARDNPRNREYQEQLATAYVNLGTAQSRANRLAEAERAFRAAVEIRERLVNELNTVALCRSRLASTDEDLAIAQHDCGHALEALRSHSRAIDLREQLMRENPTIVEHQTALGWDYERLGALHQDVGQLAEAEQAMRQAVAIREIVARQNATPDHQNNLGWSYTRLAVLNRLIGRSSDAIANCQQAIEVLENVVREHPTVVQYRDNLGWSYANLAVSQQAIGQADAAEMSFQSAIAVREILARDNTTIAKYQSDLFATYEDLAELRRAFGNNDKPEESEKEMQTISKEFPPPQRSSCP